MSKVLTFSREFPSYHPRKGEPTYFVEKIWKSIKEDSIKHLDVPDISLHHFFECSGKHHTIRGGNRFKAGDWFSPRVWHGRPYNSKQIIIAPDIQVKKVWSFELTEDNLYMVNGSLYAYPNSDFAIEPLAHNDGLEMVDFVDWFNKPFKGQIICWNENINY